MKNLLKLTLVVAMVMGASSIFAQKFGRVNMNEVIAAMPETKEAQTNLDAFIKDYSDAFETMQVELNTKMADLQKNEATLSETVKQLKYKELQDLSNRMQEYERIAQSDIQKKQQDLMVPVQQKATEAVNKVAAAGSYTAIFDTAIPSLIYINETQMTDILPLVKAELGITE